MEKIYNLKCGLIISVNKKNQIDILNAEEFQLKKGSSQPPFSIDEDVLKEAGKEIADILYKREIENEK